MAEQQQKPVAGDHGPLKCGLDPREALKRAMLVPVPDYWKKKSRSRKTSKAK